MKSMKLNEHDYNEVLVWLLSLSIGLLISYYILDNYIGINGSRIDTARARKYNNDAEIMAANEGKTSSIIMDSNNTSFESVREGERIVNAKIIDSLHENDENKVVYGGSSTIGMKCTPDSVLYRQEVATESPSLGTNYNSTSDNPSLQGRLNQLIDDKLEKDKKKSPSVVEANTEGGDDDIGDNNTWRCVCENGFLPPGLLKSFGGAEAMIRLGTGQCYHKP
jgi:hypothetical protein